MHHHRILPALTALFLGIGAAGTAGAQALDLRAASQRACVGLAEDHGYHVLHMDRPVPRMGGSGGISVGSETIRMDVSYRGDRFRVRCVYDVPNMRARLYNR